MFVCINSTSLWNTDEFRCGVGFILSIIIAFGARQVRPSTTWNAIDHVAQVRLITGTKAGPAYSQ